MEKSQYFSMRIGFILGMFLAFLSVSFAQELTPVAIHGQLHIQGNRFVDQHGKSVTLHGMSNYNWAEQGTRFYNTTAITRMAKEWKCTVIRCVMLPGNMGKQTHLVDTVIKACIANGIYVIVNWHTIGGSMGDADPCANWMKGFAERWGNTPNIMYEPWNEPTGTKWKDIKAYMQKTIDAVRPIDPDGIIIAGNPTWCQHPEEAATDPITTDKNIAYTLHFYAATHKFADFRKRLMTCMDSGRAVFCTEYGVSTASGGGNIDTGEARKWYNFMDSNGIGCTAWSISALGESSAAFFDGTSATTWTDANLKPSGLFYRAYIQSQFQTTITGISPSNFYIIRRDRGEGANIFLSEDDIRPKLFTLNGARVFGVTNTKPARGMYIFQNSLNGTARSINFVR